MLRQARLCLAVALAAAGASAQAARVYVLSSGFAPQDAALAAALAASGHNPFVGLEHQFFDGTVSLAGFDVVFLQANHNWVSSDMPQSGQTRIALFVDGGGGLVTAEWTMWAVASLGKFIDLAPLMSSQYTSAFNQNPVHQFAVHTPEPTVNAGLPPAFIVPGDVIGGTETEPPGVVAGAMRFYDSAGQDWHVGVSGRDFGAGRVAQFSQTVGQNFLADPAGARLVGNVVDWVSQGARGTQSWPDTLTVRYGALEAGGVESLALVDGQSVRICRFFVPNQIVAPVTIELEGTTPVAVPSQIRFRTFARMTTAGLFSQTLDLYDWTIGGFSSSASVTETIGTSPKWTVVGSPLPNLFVAAGRIRARVQIYRTGPNAAGRWCLSVDQASWLVSG